MYINTLINVHPLMLRLIDIMRDPLPLLDRLIDTIFRYNDRYTPTQRHIDG